MQRRKAGKPLALGRTVAKGPLQQCAVGEGDEAVAELSAAAVAKSRGLRPSIFAADDEVDDVADEAAAQGEQLAAHEASSKRKRNMDTFLEELKRGQDERLERRQTRPHARPGAGSGQDQPGPRAAGGDPADDGDTTNLYVSSLHPSVDEQSLCAAFAKYGPIGSVKIMWPRTADEHARQRNSGFVSFMERACAEEALRGMDGAELGGYTLRVSWGCRVPVPAQPVFALDAADPERQAPTGYPFNARLPGRAPGPARAPSDDEGDIAEVHVERPRDHRLVRLIHWTVEHVIRHGPQFECLLIARTVGSPRFRFLTEWASAAHVYYRWRIYSLLNGDTKSRWHDRMFFMYDRGPIWVPPRIDPGACGLAGDGPPDVDSSEAEEAAERDEGGLARDMLGQRARARLERRVRRVRDCRRGAIAEAMASAIEHAYAPRDVVDVVCARLTADGVAPGERLAALLLVSDILHNCAAPVANAWRLRDAFAERLPAAFACLAAAHRAIEARLKAEHFRTRVLAVLAVWEAWALFPQETILALAAGLLGGQRE